MFPNGWRQEFNNRYNAMTQCEDEAQIARLEYELQKLMRQVENVIRDHLRRRSVPETKMEQLLNDASRWQSLRVFHERGIPLEPDFYMLGWVLLYEDLHQGSSSVFRGLARQGGILSEWVSQFLEWMEKGLQLNNALHLYYILENYYQPQPWNLLCVQEDDYWVLFFYACAHAVYTR